MLRTIGVVALVLAASVSHAASPATKVNVFETTTRPGTEGAIDRIVFPKLAAMDLRPALCSDAVFIRRVYLDVLGTLPTSKEAREFIEDKDMRNKRRLLIDRVLEREEFASYWAMKWGDVLRIKAEFPANLWPNAAQAYHRWVYNSLATNKPYDKFVRELLTSCGSNFRVGPVNFYRAIQTRTPEGLAEGVALTLMGSRADAWPAERRAGMAAFFSQIGFKPTAEWKEEVVYWDPYRLAEIPGSAVAGKAALLPPKPEQGAAAAAPAKKPVVLKTPTPLKAVFPDGTEVTIPPDRDPRDVFADWLIRPENPWFAKSIVNRIWAWLLGRGIVHEPDDIRDDNPPVYPALLTYLEQELVKADYDMKAIYRLILNSKTYQATSLLRVKNPKAESHFGSYIVRRLDAEVLIDAINKVTGTTDLYTSAIPEPFTYIPSDMPAVAIADGSITSPFLSLFGRSARATGLMNERATRPMPGQWLHLLNSSHIQRKLESGTWMQTLTQSAKSLDDVIDELYLTILSRFPTQEEMQSIMEYLTHTVAAAESGKGGKAGKGGDSGGKAGKPPVPVGGKYAKPPVPGKYGRPPVAAGKPGKSNLPELSAAQRRDNSIDIAWALINSIEFQYRH